MKARRNTHRWLTAVSAALVSLCVASANSAIAAPNLVLWAWERTEDLKYIDKNVIAVAPLVQTLKLHSAEVYAYRRQTPLRVPDGTEIIPVTRIEVDYRNPPQLTDQQQDKVVSAILKTVRNVDRVQIDFDARVSERDFYRKLLVRLKQQSPRRIKLSITSLASWSLGDDWLAADKSLVDEIVPMFFSMGASGDEVVSRLDRGADLNPGYGGAIGIAVSSPFAESVAKWAAKKGHNPRIYVFNPKPWSLRTVARALELYRRSRCPVRENNPDAAVNLGK